MSSDCHGAGPPPASGPAENADELTRNALNARAGDRDAARAFVAATQPAVWRFLANLSDRSAADDLTQETYERAFTALPAYRGEASARTWLLAIARRVAADHLRRARRRPVLAAAPIDDPDRADDATVTEAGDHAERVVLQRLLDTLGHDRREAFVLTQILGLDYRETARVLDCPIGTVRSRVARARADLVAALHGPAADGPAADGPASLVVPEAHG
ncbi:sigma-70 family RNA polymerase sigma factor [Actinomycetospora sp. NBRC 106375]|uniref:sigma-70 family RNA polymerase sigma factor n=1 Tax=Actinomycetospora sp. NBRC 106375 TaxID=3032207 RepID=UPI002555BCE5|nr:sigma-70 family RNA polymerase sigma factor [Actinomycetospora sp. NBRC 106375]